MNVEQLASSNVSFESREELHVSIPGNVRALVMALVISKGAILALLRVVPDSICVTAARGSLSVSNARQLCIVRGGRSMQVHVAWLQFPITNIAW